MRKTTPQQQPSSAAQQSGHARQGHPHQRPSAAVAPQPQVSQQVQAAAVAPPQAFPSMVADETAALAGVPSSPPDGEVAPPSSSSTEPAPLAPTQQKPAAKRPRAKKAAAPPALEIPPPLPVDASPSEPLDPTSGGTVVPIKQSSGTTLGQVVPDGAAAAASADEEESAAKKKRCGVVSISYAVDATTGQMKVLNVAHFQGRRPVKAADATD